MHLHHSPPDPTARLRAVLALPDAPSARPALLEAARDPSHDVARAALRRLARLGGKPEAAWLRARLLDTDPGLVPDYARTLRALGDDEAVALACAGLTDRSLARRLAAATTLCEFAHPRSHDSLLAATSDPIAGVRRLAADALGRLPPGERAEATLADLLSDPDAGVRSAAVGALAATAGDRDARLEPALADPNPAVRRTLARFALLLGRTLLAALLADTDADVRAGAARALSTPGRPLDLGLLAPLLRDPAWHVRRTACRALGAGRNPDATAPLLAALLDQHPTVRAAALNALAELHQGELANVLEHELATTDARLRRALVYKLGEIGARGSAARIAQLADDPDPEVRLAVVHALATLGAGEFDHVLAQLVRDGEIAVGHAAATTLAETAWRASRASRAAGGGG